MKQIVTLLAVLLMSITIFAQQGINYKALIKDDLGNILASQIIDIKFSIIEDTGATVVYSEDHENIMTDANGMIILNIGEGDSTDVFTNINWGSDTHSLKVEIDLDNDDIFEDLGTTSFKAVPYAKNSETANNVTGLERITEMSGFQNNRGWRLINRDSENYGTIGHDAIDLSKSSSVSSTLGATGNRSIATGSNTEASGTTSTAMGFSTLALSNAEMAIGSYNTSYNPTSVSSLVETDRMFVIGNGTSNALRSDALIVLKNGTITAPSFDITEITDDKALVTKEYLEANGASGLEQITEEYNSQTGETNTGWRLKGVESTYYGPIGNKAVDLSQSASDSEIRGATGERSTAMGAATEASGAFSTAIGAGTTASGTNSTAMGVGTIASGQISTAMGLNTIASGSYSTAMGSGTKATGLNTTTIGTYNIEDVNAYFAIGNGISDAERNNALTVLKNGTITAPSFDLSEITDDKALVTKEYTDQIAAGLEAINEGNGIGWRLKGRVSNRYGNIGLNAIDLSYTNTTLLPYGATGENSFATGNRNIASGSHSNVLGSNVSAPSFAETSIGYHNTPYTPAVNGITTWKDSDRLFVIGNGTISAPNNALTVLKNGNAKFDGKIQHTSTGEANLIPTAYGNFDGGDTNTGSILSGTDNFTVARAADLTYIISVNGKNLTANNTTASATAIADIFRMTSISYSGGNMHVHIFNTSFVQVPSSFQFIIYSN